MLLIRIMVDWHLGVDEKVYDFAEVVKLWLGAIDFMDDDQ